MREKSLAEGERALRLRRAGELALWSGKKAADMTRDELLMFIGLMCETQIFQGRQLHQAAENIQSLADKLSQR